VFNDFSNQDWHKDSLCNGFPDNSLPTSGYSVWVPDRYLESETTLARQEQFEVNALNAQLVEEQHLSWWKGLERLTPCCDWQFAAFGCERMACSQQTKEITGIRVYTEK